MYTTEDCRHMRDGYARNEGATWAVMRMAFGLLEVVAPTIIDGVLFEERWTCAIEYAAGLKIIHLVILFNAYMRYRIWHHYRRVQM